MGTGDIIHLSIHWPLMQHTYKKDMLHAYHGSVSVINGFGVSIYRGETSLTAFIGYLLLL